MDINERIGKNLRDIRKLAGISAEELSDKIAEVTGEKISSDTIRRFERNERTISASDVIHLAQALECSTQAIVDGTDPRMGDLPQGKHTIKPLSKADHSILRDLASNWNGDIHALIIADGIYAAIPPHRRRAVIMELVAQADEAIRAGEITISDLPEGLAYMQNKIGGLYGEEKL